MNIAVLSGKGGTGKTTVSTNLALSLHAEYMDCDVEEPNGFIFLKPNIDKESEVDILYPVIDDDKCISCGKCVSVCQFNALAKVSGDIMLFQKLCHGCGACEIACSQNAISYQKRSIGKVEIGLKDDIVCKRGLLNIGEPMAPPVIKSLLEHHEKSDKIRIIDCPPGTSCSVVTCLKEADAAVLVTEPSQFGLHDLNMAVELVKMYNIPYGIIINKDDGNKDNIIRKYCSDNNINFIGSIPYSRNIAFIYSQGHILYEDNEYKNLFDSLSDSIKEMIKWN